MKIYQGYFMDPTQNNSLKSPRGRPFGGGEVNRIQEYSGISPPSLAKHMLPMKKLREPKKI
jgi:hypothetical protein